MRVNKVAALTARGAAFGRRTLLRLGSPVLRRVERGVHAELRDLARGDDPLVVGPWVSEVGFEVLYWIPFLRWAVREYGLDPRRLVALSRGGVADWYAGICGLYCDVFDLVDPASFRRHNEARGRRAGHQKQTHLDPFEADLAAAAVGRLGLGAARVLHPGLMYRLFIEYWGGRDGMDLVSRHSVYEPVSGDVRLPRLPGLPDRYYAAKFYYNASFPATAANRRFVAALVRRLALRRPVVLLETGLMLDDHGEVPVPDGRVVRLGAVPARDNLATQTRAVARAEAFFGTYGGFAYLAPFLGVPAYSFHSEEREFVPEHLEIAGRAVRTLRAGRRGSRAGLQACTAKEFSRLAGALGADLEVT